MNYKSNKKGLLSFIGGLMSNNKGSTLVLVVLVGACLFIVTASLLMSVNVGTNTNSVYNDSEKAYLAAKSGIQLLEDTGGDSDIINEVYSSCDGDAFVMDFDDLGTCTVNVTSTSDPETVDSATGQKTKYVLAECTGEYEGQQFVMTRKIQLKGIPTGDASTSNDIPTSAYTQYSDEKPFFDGAIDGQVNILSETLIDLKNAHIEKPIDTINCLGSINLKNSGIVANTLAAGKALYFDKCTAKENIYVGSESTDSGDDVFFYGTGSSIVGSISCEGDVIVNDFGAATMADTFPKGIGSGNYDIVNDTLISESFAAIKAGHGAESKVYLGYSATITEGEDDISYSAPTPSSNVTTVYGDVLCDGDVYLSGSVHVYGDIVCSGKVTVASPGWGLKIDGNIYANEIDFQGQQWPANMPETFTGGADLYAQTSIVFANSACTPEALSENGVNIHPNDSSTALVSELGRIVGNFVGAADYFDAVLEKNAGGIRPTTKFPDSLSSLPIVQFEEPACDDESVAKYITGNNSAGGNAQVLYITGSCCVDLPLALNGYYPINYLYIDTSKYNTDIDIYLTTDITTADGGFILVNDNGGQNLIRIFMESGSSINFTNSDTDFSGILPVAGTLDDYVPYNFSAENGFTDFPNSAMDYRVDQSKVPNLYIFAKEPADKTDPAATSSVDINIGVSGYIPGYTLTPYADIISASNSHCYVSGTKVGYKADDETTKDSTNIPFFYGMLMCHSAKLEGGTMTSVKYNDELDTDSRVLDNFARATAGVFYYDKPDGEDTDGDGIPDGGSTPSGDSGVGGFNWEIEKII